MKVKVTLAILFLIASAAVSGAAEDWQRQHPYYYYYGSAPYEYESSGYMPAASEPHRYPDYMPGEFGRQPAYAPPQPAQLREQPRSQPAYDQPHGKQPQESDYPSRREPPASDFMPYDYARERYSELNEPRRPQTPGYPEKESSDGFIPYEYAREQYSGYQPPPYRGPEPYDYDETRRPNEPKNEQNYRRRR